MRLFRRASSRVEPGHGTAETSRVPGPPDPPGEKPAPEEPVAPLLKEAVPPVVEAPPPVPEIRVSRTVVKSEPELAELVAREPRLKDERVEVTLVEKGFGTRVAIVAEAGNGLEQSDLEQLLDQLAVPQKRPFSNA
jgi:hypothetical protein